MKIEQAQWTKEKGWNFYTPPILNDSVQLVLVFGNTITLRERHFYHDIRKRYPRSHVFGCSTTGEIRDIQVLDTPVITTAIHFKYSQIRPVRAKIKHIEDSMPTGEKLARALEQEGPVLVLVLSNGLNVNGSTLIKGLVKHLPAQVTVTGGLSGDDGRFKKTLVMCDAPPETNLEIYKKYFGNHAGGLPATGLLFPLCIRYKDGNSQMVRTILSINEEDGSMIFAGDIPAGAYVWFMKANINRLIDGAGGAAHMRCESAGFPRLDLAILISCVGRKNAS